MPTVECDKRDCNNHGYDICIAKRVCFKDGECSAYIPRLGKSLIDAPFNSNCHKAGGKWRSNRVTKVFK